MKNIILIVLLAIFVCGIYSCEKKAPHIDKNKQVDYSKLPNQEAKNVVIYFSDSSITVAKLWSKRARIFQDRAKTYLDSSVYIEFFDKKNGNRISTLNADSAVIDDLTKNMTAYGKIIVFADSSKTKLETKVLQWNNADKKVYTTEYLVITSPIRIIRGYGFESDLALKNYTIYKVSGEEYINP